MRFANDFHPWLRHSWKLLANRITSDRHGWKSLANRITSDPKIVIHGNSCIILYIFIIVMKVTLMIIRKTITTITIMMIMIIIVLYMTRLLKLILIFILTILSFILIIMYRQMLSVDVLHPIWYMQTGIYHYYLIGSVNATLPRNNGFTVAAPMVHILIIERVPLWLTTYGLPMFNQLRNFYFLFPLIPVYKTTKLTSNIFLDTFLEQTRTWNRYQYRNPPPHPPCPINKLRADSAKRQSTCPVYMRDKRE